MTTANLPAVLDLPPAFDTFAERQRRTEGQVWSVGKNWYTKKGGKIRRAADPSRGKPPGVAQAGRSGKKTPTDPAKVHDAVKAILARPEALDDPKAEAELARHISGLGIKDARALAKTLESGVKERSIAGLAKKLAADAIAKAKAKGAAKPEPEKLPPAPESGKTDVSLGRPEADAIAALMPEAESYQTAELWDRAPAGVRPKLHAALLRLMDEGAIRPVSNLDSRGAGAQIPPEERAKMPQEGEYYFPSVAVFDPAKVREVLHGLAANGGKK